MKGLTFSADVTWTRLDQKYAVRLLLRRSPAVAKPAAVYELKDQDSRQPAAPRSAQLVIQFV